MKFLKLLPALIFFMLAFSYNVKSQTILHPPLCYGKPIELRCSFVTGGCGAIGSTYHWTNASGSWTSTEQNPVIYAGETGYASDKFYLQVNYYPPPGGFSGGRVTVVVYSPIVVDPSVTDILCHGQNNGTITLSVSGGSPAYSYLWTPGNITTKNRTGLSAGTYEVLVTDQKGCKNYTLDDSLFIDPNGNYHAGISDSGTIIEVDEPDEILILDSTVTGQSCYNVCDGEIIINPIGGTPSGGPYSYIWSNFATTQNLTGLCAGTYSVTVSDNNSCKAYGHWTVTAPPAITVTGTPDSVTCYGGSDGSISIIPGGGTPIYTYSWSNFQTTKDIANLTAGTYTVTISDSKGCQKVDSWTVGQPTEIVITGTPDGLKCYGINDGTISVSVVGGIPLYTYYWNDGVTTEDRSGLAPGTYTLTVTDKQSCTKSGSWVIEPAVQMTVSAIVDSVACFGGSDGSIIITPGGGVAPYLFSWSNGKTDQNIYNLTVGTYGVTITDNLGCKLDSSWTIFAPTPLNISASLNHANCNNTSDGSVSLTVTGGYTPYNYLWSANTNYATTPEITGLYAGTYSVTVTDKNLCPAYGSWTITEPGEVSWKGKPHPVSCYGLSDGWIEPDTITWGVMSPQGGTPPYYFKWSNGATTETILNLTAGSYTITVSDSHSCDIFTSTVVIQPDLLTVISGDANQPQCFGGSDGSITNVTISGGTLPYSYLWNNGAVTKDIANLTMGTYTITVKDANLCTDTKSFYVGQPTKLDTLSSSVTKTLCVGSCEGSISVVATGGTPTYFYKWDNGGTTATIENLCAGTYALTISDAHSCEWTGSWTVTSPDTLKVSGIPLGSSCNQTSDGSIAATATGGTPGYTYKWNNDAETATITGLYAGTYTITVTDLNGCKVSGFWTVTEPGEVSWKGKPHPVSCYGLSDGWIEPDTITWGVMSPQGGTPPYYFKWSNGATTETILNLTAGSYTITVSDAHSCDIFTSTVVIQPDLLTVVSGDANQPQCFGGSDGSITNVTVSGGTLPYSYLWNNGAVTKDIANLTMGTYTITVKDANLCTDTKSFYVGQPTKLDTLSSSVTKTLCVGSCEGSISVVATGGTPNYFYKWDNGGTTATIENLCAGTYALTITDAHSCEWTGSWTVTSPDTLKVSGTPYGSSCNQTSDGSIIATATGGTPGYTYKWNTDAETATITGLYAGTYTITVTDLNGCKVSGFWTVTEPGEVSWKGKPHPVSCYGLSDGWIEPDTITWGVMSPQGGTPPYYFKWSNGATTETILNLTAGSYTITVSDAHSCDIFTSTVVIQPDLLTVVSGDANQPQCFGGSDGSITNVTVSGGTLPYSYLWNNGAVTKDIANLTMGTYTITVKDANLCTDVKSFYVGQPTQVDTLSSSVTKTLCVGSCEGSISVVATGGTPNYFYKWNNGGTTATIENLCAGTYALTITDAHSCEWTGSWTVTSPDTLKVSGTPYGTSCNQTSDGSIVATATGGTPGYTYKWNTDAETATITGLYAGTYTITVTDLNGCKVSGFWTVSEPSEVSWKGKPHPVSCYGLSDGWIEPDTITWGVMSPQGGTPPYSFKWSNGATTETIYNLLSGSYTITVTDSHGCDIFTSTVVIQPDLLTVVSGDANQPKCFGGSDGSITNVTISGGTLPYSYLWNNGAVTKDIANLTMGTYTITVKDANLCTDIKSFYVGQPTQVDTLSSSVTNTLCFGTSEGSISVVATGGTPDPASVTGYYYNWSNNKTTPEITGLIAGTYTVTISDANSCEWSGSWTVTSPDLLSVNSIAVTGTSCNQTSDGSITTITTGGTKPYTYEWNTAETGPDLTGLYAGTYTLTVTDFNNCQAINSWIVTEPGEVSWKGKPHHVSCYGLSDGWIEPDTITWGVMSPQGGTPPYYYKWSTGETTPVISNLVAGEYFVTVSDAHSCDIRTSTWVLEPAILALNPIGNYTIPTCYKGDNGAITVQPATGGTQPYAYKWSTGATSLTITGLTAGSYTLSVTDAHSCFASQVYRLDDAPSWTFEIGGDTVVCCNTSTINDTVSYWAFGLVGASDPISYQWVIEGGQIVEGDNTPNIKVVWSCCGTGKVWLTVTQGPNHCKLTKWIDIDIVPTPTPVIIGSISVIAGDTAVYCVENGDPTHLYTWAVDASGTVIDGWGTSCITVVWGDYPSCGCGLVTVCEATQIAGVPGCEGCTFMNITVLPDTSGINLSGTVSYKNPYSTALDGVVLNLRNLGSNAIVATTVSGPNMNPPNYTGESGYYAFMNVAPGNYKIEASFDGTWGGNNATDALLIQIEAGNANYLLPDPPYGVLNLAVANVNGSTLPMPNGVSALDALYVKLRTVGSISSYPAGDWKFKPANPAHETINIPAEAGTVDFKGLCFGDVNGSYIPTGLKELSYMSVVDGMTQTVPVGENFTYSIRSNSSAKLGAMTLFMGYDAERFEVIDIASQNEEMKYVISEGTVAIAWADTKPLSVENDDQLFMITVKAKSPITDATSIFEVKTQSEFADAIGTRYDNFQLKMSKVITPNGSKEFTLFNYPNPFSDNTKIIYTLPESGSVKLVVTDIYGKTIRTLVDESQSAGNYTVNINAAELNLSSGVYLYRIEVSGATENFVKINKLVFAR